MIVNPDQCVQFFSHSPFCLFLALMIVGRMAVEDDFTFIDQVEVFIESFTFTINLDDSK